MGFTVSANRLRLDGKAVDYRKSLFMSGPLPTPTRILVMHFTYGGTASSSAEWFRDPANKPGSSAHVIVDRDGSVIQCVPFDRIAWHAGKSTLGKMNGLNQYSIGIELANWGPLKPAGSEWKSHTGVTIANPHMAIHENGNPDKIPGKIGWEPYPAVQFQTAAAIARALADACGIDQIVGHDLIAPTRKWDPGPAFDMAHFRSRVFGGRADNDGITLTVDVAEGLNLRDGAGVSSAIIRLLPMGTKVDPIERDGRWLSVSVLNAQGEPSQTGWVHERYLS